MMGCSPKPSQHTLVLGGPMFCGSIQSSLLASVYYVRVRRISSGIKPAALQRKHTEQKKEKYLPIYIIFCG